VIVLSIAILSILNGCGSGPTGNAVTQAMVENYKVTYAQRVAKFATETDVAGKTMMVGDSITQLWSDDGTFPADWTNRGIYGDNTNGVIKRLQQHLDQRPKDIVLLIGANDGIADYQQNILTIIRMVKASGIKLSVVSVLPALKGAASDATIAEMNAILSTVCPANGVDYLNINGYFKMADGHTNPDLLRDTVHPNHNGFNLMASLFQKLYDPSAGQQLAGTGP
jgi:lysophospholipase L1-like esterase